MPPAASSGQGRRNAHKPLAAQISDSEHNCRSGQSKEVQDRGFFAGEHQVRRMRLPVPRANGALRHMRANSDRISPNVAAQKSDSWMKYLS